MKLTLASLGTAEKAQLSSSALEAGDATDADLPDDEKRSRKAPLLDAGGNALAIGDPVTVPWGDAVLLGPGRGRDALLVGWVEDGHECYGTAFVHQARAAK